MKLVYTSIRSSALACVAASALLATTGSGRAAELGEFKRHLPGVFLGTASGDFGIASTVNAQRKKSIGGYI